MQASLERLRRRREELGDEGGFTLIELLIVIVILGILAAIVVFAVQNLTSQSVKASCGSDYKTVETALETYKAQVGHYPTDGSPAGPTPATQPAITGDAWATAPGVPANTGKGGTPSTFGDGVEALYQSQPALNGTGLSGSTTAGPWLKDAPANGNSYRVWIVPGGITPTSTATYDASALTDGPGTVLVQNVAKQPLDDSGHTALVLNNSGTDGAKGTISWDTTTSQWVASTTAPGVNMTCTFAGL